MTSDYHLLIIPGWRHTATDWEPVMAKLTERSLSSSCMSFPEFSSNTPETVRENVTEFAESVVSHIALQAPSAKILLVGHSFGGRIAVDVANRWPKKIAALCLIGSPNIYRPTIGVRFIKLVSRLTAPVAHFMPLQWKSRFRSLDYSHARNSPLHTLYLNTITCDQTESLRSLTLPTLIVNGENDEDAPVAIASEIATLIPTAELKIIRNGGHNLHLDNSTLLAATLAAYVDSL